ncbi:flagellin [uncultured Tateyamaria sp.]|uniref:flagellin n=1 Tax=Tateyamaria sp. 1078 TaxID=3417464 RepID=UPI002604CA7D|nr:flagellin [uncultured Tateyamaria sp.]
MINATSFGDLAQSFLLQRRGADLKTEMSRLNQELVTGQVADVKAVLAGNTSYLAGIESDLRTLQGYRTATDEAAFFTDAMQTALDRVQSSGTNFSQDLLTTAKNGPEPVLDQLSRNARTELETIVSALNTFVGGRAVFGGTATGASPLADVDTIMTDLRSAVAGLTSVDDILAAVDTWFDDPSGYADVAYNGSATPLAPMRIGADETVDVRLTAENAALRDVIQSIATSALVEDLTLTLSVDQKREMLDRMGVKLLGQQDGLTAIRAEVGAAQERIDTVAARNSAQSTSLEYAKGALLGADPYETATKLEEVQFQLQSLYTITARMSDLSLVNFIR